MESQAIRPKKRVRKRRLDLQFELALRDAAAATESGADAATKGLIQTRLNILSQQLNRIATGKLKRAQAELVVVKAENERLKADLGAALAPLKCGYTDLDAKVEEALKRLGTAE